MKILIVAGISLGVTCLAATPTFHKDIEPILQNNCESCHRPGQIGPMSLVGYRNVRPWAKAIKNAVSSRKMPPWFADPKFGHFANDRSLKATEIEAIGQWADAGAPEGDAKDAPMARNWPADGWQIQPDVVVDGHDFKVPASTKANVIEWTYITVPSGIKEDTWVTSMEIRPSALDVTHHICIYFKPHTPTTEYYKAVWADKPRDEKGLVGTNDAGGHGKGLPEDLLKGASGPEGCYVPGQFAQDYRKFNAAKLIKAGTDIIFQMHYTPNGKDLVDHPRLGFTVAKAAPAKTYVTIGTSSPTDAKSFAIPPNAPNWESPPMEAEFLADVDLVAMFPHMHLRGKDMTYTLTYPDGRVETVLSVPRYDFNWQLEYQPEKPIHVPKGTKVKVTAHFDNSANNKFNPDPSQTVYYGDMSWEEMMFPFFGITSDQPITRGRVLRIVRGREGDGA